MSPFDPNREAGDASLALFVKKVLIVAAVVAMLFILWQIRHAALLGFAGVIVAVILASAAEPVRNRTGLSQRLSVAIAAVTILTLSGFFLWLLWPQVQTQSSELLQRIPVSLQELERRFGISIKDMGGAGATMIGNLAQRLTSWSAAVLGVVASLALVIFAGVFLAADPARYRTGVVKLFPQGQHERIERALTVSGRGLKLWLLAQLLSMSIVGVVVAAGTWLIGLPSPLALGIVAAITEFIPVLGPVLGAVPALLVALTEGTATFLWTLALFIAVQQLESNIITPLVQERMVNIPPALLILAIAAFGYLFGIVGVLVAAPLTVVAYILVKQLYVRQTLGEPTPVPGEKKDG